MVSKCQCDDDDDDDDDNNDNDNRPVLKIACLFIEKNWILIFF